MNQNCHATGTCDVSFANLDHLGRRCIAHRASAVVGGRLGRLGRLVAGSAGSAGSCATVGAWAEAKRKPRHRQ